MLDGVDPAAFLEGHPVALSVYEEVRALGREVRSGRFKEVVHPAGRHWMHHLEVHGPDEIDDEVVEWLAEAFERAG
jgi:hypothetical protein